MCDTSHKKIVGDMNSSPPPQFSSSPFAASENGYTKLGKPKKPATVTPKRFTRFFTPRSSSCWSSSLGRSSSGRQLRDITRNATNSSGRHVENPAITISFADVRSNKNGLMFSPCISSRKRKGVSSCRISPSKSSPCKRPRTCQLSPDIYSDPATTSNDEPEAEQTYPYKNGVTTTPYIKRKPLSGINGRILQRAFGPYQIRASYGKANEGS